VGYPSQWERHLVLGDDWKVIVRPVRAADEPLILVCCSTSARKVCGFASSIRSRGSATRSSPADPSATRSSPADPTDYARAMAFVAFDETSADILGVVQVHRGPTGNSGEYAILLKSDLKNRGLGWTLMQMIIEYGKSGGLAQITGEILMENSVMLKMCREFGFEVKTNPADFGVYEVTLILDRPHQRDDAPVTACLHATPIPASRAASPVH
jgi:acetyltransferase